MNVPLEILSDEIIFNADVVFPPQELNWLTCLNNKVTLTLLFTAINSLFEHLIFSLDPIAPITINSIFCSSKFKFV